LAADLLAGDPQTVRKGSLSSRVQRSCDMIGGGRWRRADLDGISG